MSDFCKHCLTGLAMCAGALLSACGGGSDGAATPLVENSDVPVSATQNAQAATDFVRMVVADDNEAADVLRIDEADLATSETDEPQPDI